MYQPLEITERMKKVKEQYFLLPVAQELNPYVDKKYRHFRSGDRWITLGYLRGWKQHKDAPTTLMRTAYAEAQELYEAQPILVDDELLMGQLYLPEYSAEDQAEYDALCDAFEMSSHTLLERAPRKDHIGLDFDKLLDKGILGIQAEIREEISKLNLSDPAAYPDYEVVRKYEFYQCLLIELDAVLNLAERYAQVAEEKAEQAQGEKKQELLEKAERIRNVPAHPAKGFYEAVQSVHFFLSTLFGLYPLCRPDRYLYRFYRQDIDEGKIQKELAQELIDNFCLGVSTRVFSRAACGFMVGGLDEEGNVVENDLTYMFLTALDHLKLPDPNGALAVNSKTGDEILLYAADVLSHGTTHPAFYNDEVIIPSLVKNYGCEEKDAVSYIHATCAEMSVAGKSKAHTTSVYVDLPKMMMAVTDRRQDFESFSELWQAVIDEIRGYVEKQHFMYLTRMLEASRVGNEQMRVCALIDDCIQRGKSIYEGGERYTFIAPIFVGFSTLLESLSAIKTLVFEKNELTLERFHEIVKSDFEGEENLRRKIIRNLPHYGNDNPEIDGFAAELAHSLEEIFHSTIAGNVMMAGTFSYNAHAGFGSRLGATYDGRKAGYSYSDGCCPVQGWDVNGPTSLLLSLSSWDQSRFLGGMVVNLKFSKEHLTGEKKRNFIELLRTFFQRGGIEVQVNVVDRQTLLDARECPDNHRDLIVRIGGYSDYFIRLTPTLQQEIIDRTEY